MYPAYPSEIRLSFNKVHYLGIVNFSNIDISNKHTSVEALTPGGMIPSGCNNQTTEVLAQ